LVTDDPAALWRDWTTIWQSELAGMATDREQIEGMAAAARIWAGVAAAMQQSMKEMADGSQPGTGTAPGAAAAADASGAGDAEIERLARRVAELERRLDALDRPKPDPVRRTRRKSAPA
jgi:hypothetical protein